jgi:transcriptional regulator with XRE-family HTH domain
LRQTPRGLFGTRLKSLRLKRGLSQEEFAHLTGYSRSYVSLVENARYSASLDAIVAFANVLKVKPTELLRGIT